MDREMTPSEKAEYKRHFPNLDVDRARVTDNATGVYNCIAWTVDVDWDWLWPGSTINEFDVFYQGYGFVRQSSGPVAVWAFNGDYNQMTHGCISGPGHGPRWESKCGAGLRIQHGLTELEGPKIRDWICRRGGLNISGRFSPFFRSPADSSPPPGWPGKNPQPVF